MIQTLLLVLFAFFLPSHCIPTKRSFHSVNQVTCENYVPDDYEREVSPEPKTLVDFEYLISNFDVVDVEDYVSHFFLLIIENNRNKINNKMLPDNSLTYNTIFFLVLHSSDVDHFELG